MTLALLVVAFHDNALRCSPAAPNPVRRGFDLGLALVREVALRVDGRVAAVSASPRGTPFLVTRPAAR